MERIEQVYAGVRECERNRKAIVIMVHMLFVARQSGACDCSEYAPVWDTMEGCILCE